MGTQVKRDSSPGIQILKLTIHLNVDADSVEIF